MTEQTKVRRIITHNDPQGLSYIYDDNVADNVVCPIPGNQELALINLWGIKSVPTTIADLGNFNNVTVPLTPGKNGVTFRYVDFPPDSTYTHLLGQPEEINKAWDQLESDQTNLTHKQKPHPLMHCTSTVDFGIVLTGEIYLVLDKEERLMKAGDVAIQRATNHAWSNRSDQLCRMAFILIDAQ